jgi:hypothetical protein
MIILSLYNLFLTSHFFNLIFCSIFTHISNHQITQHLLVRIQISLALVQPQPQTPSTHHHSIIVVIVNDIVLAEKHGSDIAVLAMNDHLASSDFHGQTVAAALRSLDPREIPAQRQRLVRVREPAVVGAPAAVDEHEAVVGKVGGGAVRVVVTDGLDERVEEGVGHCRAVDDEQLHTMVATKELGLVVIFASIVEADFLQQLTVGVEDLTFYRADGFVGGERDVEDGEEN